MSRPSLRVRALVLPAIFGALLLTTFAARQGQDLSQVVIKGAKVAGNVHFLLGRGGNIGVLAGADGVLVVDNQYAPLAPKIEAAIGKISKEPLRFVLNTHWHGDHTGGNAHFGSMVPLLAHENVRRRLAADPTIEGRTAADTPAGALPVLTYADSISLHLNGEDIVVRHFPRAHTDGDSVVFFRGSNVVHMGDLYFSIAFPFIDLDSGGGIDGLMEAIADVIEDLPEDARVIPGHGPVTGVEELRAYLTVLSDCRLLVEDALQSGWDAEKMKAEGLLRDYEERGSGFVTTDRFIDTLVRDLSTPR